VGPLLRDSTGALASGSCRQNRADSTPSASWLASPCRCA